MKKRYSKKWINKDTRDLFETIACFNDLDKLQKFLRDLMTEGEIIEFGKRWKVARMLHQKIKYSEIEKETGLSSATIARVHSWLTEGMGGYKLALKKSDKNE
jgi:TrpR-related protein YerC/YecD